mmetsp:Transcript_27410/g.72807  ORF Transcript_27410/g.72807 Transcript_27410/m.72807 type:complete len:224 (+) Transcript_27410:134-805(+)
MSAAFRFHSVTIPSTSTPKIGALALSMSLDKSSAILSCSLALSRICVMSCPTPMTPVTSLLGPRLVVALINTSRLSPPFVNKAISKLAVSLPINAKERTSLTDCWNSSVMNVFTRSLPIVCSLLKPSKRAAVAFHSVTLPFVSIPKIGALAVSISLPKSSATCLDLATASFNSLMSCPTPTTPVTLPALFRRVVALSNTVYRFPLFDSKGNSKLAVSIPRSAF